jgi:hypothetical protein
MNIIEKIFESSFLINLFGDINVARAHQRRQVCK